MSLWMPERRAARPEIRFIKVNGLLSFGPRFTGIELRPLNVLIGPNASGKSNFIEMLALCRALTVDLQRQVQNSGGAARMVHRHQQEQNIHLRVDFSLPNQGKTLSYFGDLLLLSTSCQVGQESVFWEGQKEHPLLYRTMPEGTLFRDEAARKIPLNGMQSVLQQLRDPVGYADIAPIQSSFGDIAIYQEWRQGRSNILKGIQSSGARSDRIEENFSNLAMFLSSLEANPAAKRAITEAFKDVYHGADGYTIVNLVDQLEIRVIEGDVTYPASRLSDGTLRYLALCAILHDPTPPSLICLEEPELGLHPDLIPKIATMLKVASERTQLVVTTHSEILVDALSDSPEDIVVCERIEGETAMTRLDQKTLGEWLKDYSLGELWTRGVIGGNRW